MQNPILTALRGRTPVPQNNIAQMLRLVNNSQNPQQMLNYLAQQNPQLRQILTMVNNSNMSPRDLFYKLAEQKGVDPQQILNSIQPAQEV